jgi:hypothetical protein
MVLQHQLYLTQNILLSQVAAVVVLLAILAAVLALVVIEQQL